MLIGLRRGWDPIPSTNLEIPRRVASSSACPAKSSYFEVLHPERRGFEGAVTNNSLVSARSAGQLSSYSHPVTNYANDLSILKGRLRSPKRLCTRDGILLVCIILAVRQSLIPRHDDTGRR